MTPMHRPSAGLVSDQQLIEHAKDYAEILRYYYQQTEPSYLIHFIISRYQQTPNSMLSQTQTTQTSHILLRKVPQLGQLIQQLLQIPIGNLILQTRD